jgi:hypothetical protein
MKTIPPEDTFQQLFKDTLSLEEFRSLMNFCAEHEANIPRYKKAKAQMDAVWTQFMAAQEKTHDP